MAEINEYDGEERRRQRRLSVNGRLYVTAHRSGLIADISSEGLAFHYIERKRWPAWSSDKLTICADEIDFILPGIAYNVACDQPLSRQKDPALVVKRMGLSFGPLSAEQQDRLIYLLQQFT